MIKISPISEHSAVFRLNSIFTKAQNCSEYRLLASISCFLQSQEFFEYAKLYNVEVLHSTKLQGGLFTLILPSPSLFLVELTSCNNFPAFLSHINEYLNIQMYLFFQPSELAIDTLVDNLTTFDILETKYLSNSDLIYLVDFDDSNEFDLPLEGYFLGNNVSAPWKI